ncbi:alkaline phosphatase-like [Diadema antillarum]|uniref:alkaline phosphatase-like n=1 Tax=Diadema antillarum TaxID=105358 RepID=UPI003A8A345E
MKAYAVLATIFVALVWRVGGQDAEFWNNQAQESIRTALRLQTLNIGQAKNIIFFLGDGMSIPTITAARIRQGQLAGTTGEENNLAWDTFPHVGLVKTYNTDAQTPDSAGTATAFFCGVKTKSGIIGLDDGAEYDDCTTAPGTEVDSVLQLAHRTGKATGVISTARVTHATPSALYAHSPNRNWENSKDINSTLCPDSKDIAAQLVDDNAFIKVIMGGGRQEFQANNITDDEYPNARGQRTDGRDLIAEWQAGKTNAQYVWNKDQFDEVDHETTDFLLGLFERSHMNYASDAEAGNDPSLASMTEKAIRILQKEPNGFFLAVEGGRVDHSHHAGRAFDALGDTIALSDAVEMALELTDDTDTLIIVTADHSHTMAFSGYPVRGNPILGLVDEDYDAADGYPYTTLGYLNGPGGSRTVVSFNFTGHRRDHTETDTEDSNFLQDALVPLSSETHGGDDVAIYAIGPMAHLFHGVHEQNYIAHVMTFAGCYDDTLDNVCNSDVEQCPGGAGMLSATKVPVIIAAIVSVLMTYFL